MLAGLLFARPWVQPAAEAIDELCQTMDGLLAEMAAGLPDGTAVEKAPGWLACARSLGGEIRRVDDALREADESIRLSPHLTWLSAVETQLRGIAWSPRPPSGCWPARWPTARGSRRTAARCVTRRSDCGWPQRSPSWPGRCWTTAAWPARRAGPRQFWRPRRPLLRVAGPY